MKWCGIQPFELLNIAGSVVVIPRVMLDNRPCRCKKGPHGYTSRDISSPYVGLTVFGNGFS